MSRSLEELRELADREVSDGASGAESTDGRATETGAAATDSDGRSWLGRPPVTPKGLLLSLVVTGAGLLAGGAIPLLGGLLQYVGLFAAAFLLGAVRSRRAYVETGAAGAAASGVLFVATTLTSVNVFLGANLLAEYGVAATGAAVAGIGVGSGLVLSLAGYYFGRDLRAGLTRDI